MQSSMRVGRSSAVAVIPSRQTQDLQCGAEVGEHQLRHLAKIDAGLLNQEVQQQQSFRHYWDVGKIVGTLQPARVGDLPAESVERGSRKGSYSALCHHLAQLSADSV